ncbi:MAG: cytotoxic translational repressor of toxin-antitoxin stability system [Puniceicoccales bacterium]|jgi:mRNA interferase RelE/StbE|nr:cytotoxic translational repressor of toxin-antitoxin stability system [Puniceicoccales bacterium]
MYQINFSEQSLVEFNKMDKLIQLQFIDKLSEYCDECLRKEFLNVKKFRRENTDIYRCRINDLRIYFETKKNIVFCTYILHQHTLSDFLYRNKLPISDEQMFEQYDSFWKYLDTLRKN